MPLPFLPCVSSGLANRRGRAFVTLFLPDVVASGDEKVPFRGFAARGTTPCRPRGLARGPRDKGVRPRHAQPARRHARRLLYHDVTYCTCPPARLPPDPSSKAKAANLKKVAWLPTAVRARPSPRNREINESKSKKGEFPLRAPYLRHMRVISVLELPESAISLVGMTLVPVS